MTEARPLPALPFPTKCPACGGVILWLDRQSSPDLVYVGHQLVGCARCQGKTRAPAAPPPRPARSILGTEPTHDPRTVREIVAQDMPKVIEFISDGAEVIQKAADFWQKIKPKPKR